MQAIGQSRVVRPHTSPRQRPFRLVPQGQPLLQPHCTAVDPPGDGNEILIVVVIAPVVGQLVQSVVLPEPGSGQGCRTGLQEKIGLLLQGQINALRGGAVVPPASELDQAAAAVAPAVATGFVAVAEP